MVFFRRRFLKKIKCMCLLQTTTSEIGQCRDYSNGGPAFICYDGHTDAVEELAWYEGKRGAAAVKCKVSHLAACPQYV